MTSRCGSDFCTPPAARRSGPPRAWMSMRSIVHGGARMPVRASPPRPGTAASLRSRSFTDGRSWKAWSGPARSPIARSGGGDMATGGLALLRGTILMNAPPSDPTSASCPLRITACFVMSDFAASTRWRRAARRQRPQRRAQRALRRAAGHDRPAPFRGLVPARVRTR